MKKIALLYLLMSQGVWADTPPVPAGGLSFYFQSPCSDVETDLKGYCYLGKDMEGRNYLTFWQSDTLMFIREITGDTYKVIWVNPQYNSF